MAVAAVILIMVAAAYQAQAQKKAGREAKKQKEMQAAQQEHMGSVVALKSQMKAQDIRDDARRLMSTQRAQMAAAGVSLSSGSPVEMFTETIVQGEKDAQRVLWLGKQETDVHRFNATLLSWEGSVLKTQANRQAVGTLLGGMAGAASAGTSMSGSSTATTTT